MQKKVIKLNKHGFTLIELMISVAMVAILSAATLQIARFSETQKNLTLATDEVRAAIRMAQSYSLSIPNVDNRHICGFGFRRNGTGAYNVYYKYNADFNNNPNLCKGDLSSGSIEDSASMETFSIKEGVLIGGASEVFFRSPYGDPIVARTFRLSSNGVNKDIAVSGSGQIN